MLTTLAVSGYRSLRDIAVPLAPLTVVTGPNGSGKSNLYRALRLLAATASGGLIGALAREGGLPSVLWAGPEHGGLQGTVRTRPIAVNLGFASDELGYLVDLGIPQYGGKHFGRDPEIKREQVFAGPVAKPSSLLIDRLRSSTRVRDGSWTIVRQELASYESIVTDLADGDTAPELLALRRMLGGWRFYDHFRVDADAPARQPQIGTRAHTLAHDGENLAAVWATVEEAGFIAPLDREVDRAFPGARIEVISDESGRFRLALRQPGILRPLEAAELSDGTLRYLLLCAALLPARPAPLLVLNEPESSLHPSLLGPLAELIASASTRSQVIVVTHADALARPLEAAGAALVRLEPRTEGTTVAGQGLIDAPPWNWGTR